MTIWPVTNCLMRLMMTTWRHGAGQSCVLLWQAITSNNPNNSTQNHVGADQDGLKLISCCFYVSVVGVQQLSWVDEIIFGVCISLDTTQTLTLTSEIWPGIIGAISFNVATVIATTEIISGACMASLWPVSWCEAPGVSCHHRPVSAQCQSVTSESRESWELLPEREPAHYAPPGQAVAEECWAAGGGAGDPARPLHRRHWPQATTTGHRVLGAWDQSSGDQARSQRVNSQTSQCISQPRDMWARPLVWVQWPSEASIMWDVRVRLR